MLPERFGPFVLLKKLGAGGMGDAHLARPVVTEAGVPPLLVVKRIHPELAAEDKMLRRFQHEAAIATTIDSPHVARVFSAGKVGETLYIAMEYIAGWPLSGVLSDLRAEGRRITVSSAIDLVSDALRGVGALHLAKDEHGSPLAAVHRDVSPKNLMLGEDGRVRVIDLGLGKSRLRDWHTRTGAIMGTPGYMAPEQTLARDVDHRTDLYAIGIVLFEVLTLAPYVTPGPIADVLMRMAKPVFRAPSTARPEINPALDAVAKRALAIEAEDRFASADEFLRALEAARVTQSSRAPASTLVSELLFTEMTRERVEVQGLLASSAGEGQSWDEPTIEPTVVFARMRGQTRAVDVANTLPLLERAAQPAKKPALANVAVTAAVAAACLLIGMQIERRSGAAAAPPPAPLVAGPPSVPVAVPGVIAAAPASPEPPIQSPAPSGPARPAPRATSASPVSAAPASAAPRSSLARRDTETLAAWMKRLTDVVIQRRKQSAAEDPALEDVMMRLTKLSARDEPIELENELDAIARALE